jgi:hypothetical protein
MGVPKPTTPLQLIAYSIGKGRNQRKKLKEQLANKNKEIQTNRKNNPKADPTKVNAGASNPATQSGTPKYQPHAGGSRRISQQHSKTFHMVNGKPRLFTSGNGENK